MNVVVTTSLSRMASSDAVRIRRQERLIGELRERVRHLEGLLAPEVELPEAWGLVRREKQVFWALLTKETVSPEHLSFVMYQHDAGEAALQTVHSHVSRMRKKLRSIGVVVVCQRYEGYRLEDRLGWKARLG